MKVKYCIFTIGQISGHYASHNETYDKSLKSAKLVDLNGDYIKDLEVTDNTVSVTLDGWKVVTIQLIRMD